MRGDGSRSISHGALIEPGGVSDVEKAAALKSSCNKETWLQKGSFAGSRFDDTEVTKSTDD